MQCRQTCLEYSQEYRQRLYHTLDDTSSSLFCTQVHMGKAPELSYPSEHLEYCVRRPHSRTSRGTSPRTTPGPGIARAP